MLAHHSPSTCQDAQQKPGSLKPAICTLCSCATPLDVSLTYIPTRTPRRAVPVWCKCHFFHLLQQFSTVLANHIVRSKKDQFQNILEPQMKQIFGWVLRHHPGSDALTTGVWEMKHCASDHQTYNCVWTAAGQCVRHSRSSLNRPISQKTGALCQLYH